MIVSQGALNLASVVVPDLYVVVITPQNYLINGVPTNVLGVVGTASWGPVNTPITVGAMTDYVKAFSTPATRKYDMGTTVAVAIQQGATNFRCVRVTDGTDTAATVTSPATCITYTAAYTGSAGNNISVAISNGSKANTFRAVISVPGGVPEVFDNVAGTGNAFWVNLANAINSGTGVFRGPSQLVVATAGVGTTAPSAQTATLTGGTDGAAPGSGHVTAATLIGVDTTPRKGMYALRNLGCSIMVLSDCDDSTQWTTADGFAAQEGIYNILTTPSGDTIANAASVRASTGLDSYASKLMLGNWVLWNDPFNSVQRYVSPQGFAAGRLANLSPEQSSLNKRMSGIVGTQQTLATIGASSTFSQAELQQMILGGIDTITNPGGGGVIMWTDRSGHNTSSNAVIQGDWYTRMTNFIAASLNTGMGIYLGQPITPTLVQRIKATLTSFFMNMLGQGLLGPSVDDGGVPFSVIADIGPGTNNPPSMTKLGYLRVDCQVQYLSINERFIVNVEGGQSVTITRQATGTVGQTVTGAFQQPLAST